MVANLILLAYALSASTGLIFLKLGSKDGGAPVSFADGRLHLNIGFYVISGMLLYIFSFMIYTYLISKNDLGYIIPVSTALVYIFIFVASYIVFKESFTALKIIAIIMIIAGVTLLGLQK